MKFKNAMQLKALLNNLATRQKLSPQLVLQNYYIERFLERLSMSEYRPNLILKGGVLMSNLVGLNFRTTMDIDTTIIGIPMEHESVRDVFQKICNMQVDDDVAFEVTGVTNIADHNDYPGLRVGLLATQMPMKTKIEIDITTGDCITPDVVERELKLMFDAGVCKVFGSTPILVEMAKWVWGCEIEFPGYEVDHRGVSLEGVVAPCLPFSCLNHSVDSFTYRVRQALPEVREDFRLVA